MQAMLPCCRLAKNLSCFASPSFTILPGVVQLLSFFPEKKMQHFRSITGAVEGVMLPPRVVRIDDEGRAAPAR